MSHFKHVKSNVKGGVDVELGEKTIIIGPNGSGKSAIQNSLELATRGFVTDLTGRAEVRRESDLFSLGDDLTLFAEAELSDGTQFRWETERTAKGSVQKAKSSQPVPVAWPVLDIEAMLKGNADTQRKWILRMASGVITREAIHAHVTDTDLYDSIADGLRMSEADALARVTELAASKATKAKSAMAASEKTVESMSRGLEPEPSEAEIEKLQQRVDAAQDQIQAPAAAPSITAEQVKSAEERAVQAVESWTDLTKQLEDATQKRAAIEVPATALLIQSLSQTVKLAAEHNLPACVMCGSSNVPHWAQLAEQYDAHLAQYGEARNLDTLISVRTPQVEQAKQHATQLVEAYTKLKESFEAQAPAVVVDNTQAAENLRQAQNLLSQARAAQASWKRVRDEREMLKEHKATHRNMAALKSDCRSALDELSKKALKSIEEVVQSYLPESDRFFLESDDKAVSMGFMRDDLKHTALSGAEWARLTMAVAAAQLRLTHHEGPAVLTPTERAWDPDSLAAAMRALSEAPGQVLLLSPIKPKGRLPKGWMAVETGE